MSQGDPQHTASSGLDIKPASTSNEALVMATTRNIFKSPSPTLQIRGTHKTASEDQERCTDFDLALEKPDRTLLNSLKMDGISYDTHDMGGFQDQIRVLYNSVQGDTKADQNVYVRIVVANHNPTVSLSCSLTAIPAFFAFESHAILPMNKSRDHPL